MGLLGDAGHAPEGAGLFAPSAVLVDVATGTVVPLLRRRNESILRTAVRWGIVGALLVELPFLAVLPFVHMDTAVLVFLAVSLWKFGAGFGAWFGAMAGQERGLEPELATAYERHLASGRWLVTARAGRRERPQTRGALMESGASDVRDVQGTFIVKPPPRTKRAFAFP